MNLSPRFINDDGTGNKDMAEITFG